MLFKIIRIILFYQSNLSWILLILFLRAPVNTEYEDYQLPPPPPPPPPPEDPPEKPDEDDGADVVILLPTVE